MNSKDKANQLIRKIQRGDREAIGVLYQEYRAEFLKWSLSQYAISESQAIDIFQNGVIAFYRNVAQGKLIQLNSSIKTYLFAICKNLILKQLRDQKNTVAVDDPILAEVMSLDVVKEREETHQKKIIHRAIMELGEPCNEIIRMFYFRGFAMEIIKERMGYKSEGVARTQKKRCMQYLQKLILEKYKKELDQ